jgi:hypothetical protein
VGNVNFEFRMLGVFRRIMDFGREAEPGDDEVVVPPARRPDDPLQHLVRERPILRAEHDANRRIAIRVRVGIAPRHPPALSVDTGRSGDPAEPGKSFLFVVREPDPVTLEKSNHFVEVGIDVLDLECVRRRHLPCFKGAFQPGRRAVEFHDGLAQVQFRRLHGLHGEWPADPRYTTHRGRGKRGRTLGCRDR